MSRYTIFRNDRIHVVSGDDHVLGKFYQIFDKNFENETPEGEGLVYEWSERFGVERNYTGYPNSSTQQTTPEAVIEKYIKDNTIEQIEQP